MINVEGLKLEDIMNMDVRKLDIKDMRIIANRMVSATNKRIRRLKGKSESINYKIPSLKTLSKQNRGRQFTIKHKPFKGKYAEQKERGYLLNKITKMKYFNTLKTSSVRGAMKVESEIKKRLGSSYTKLSKGKKNKFWDLYQKVVEERPDLIGNKEKSKELQKEVLKQFKTSISEEEQMERIRKFIEEELPKITNEEEENKILGMDEYFEEYNEDDLPF